MNAKTNRKRLKYTAPGETIWLADNHAWEISKDADGYHLTSWDTDGHTRAATWSLSDDLIEKFHTKRLPFPKYVATAVVRHCN